MDYTLSNVGMLKAQFRIVVALMLHDIRSRFGGNALGFVGMGYALYRAGTSKQQPML